MNQIDKLLKHEYLEKLRIKKQLEKEQNERIDEKGLKSFERIGKYLKGMNYFIDRGIINAHLDFEPITQKLANKESFYLISGRNPSGPIHLGHLSLFKLLLEFQKLGANVVIPFTNDESFVDCKNPDFKTGKQIALETIPYLIAMGFKPEKTKVFIHTDYPDLYKIAMYFGNFVNTNQLKSLFGESSINSPSKVFYRGALQLASILMLQLEEFGGKQNVLVPVSADQHPYILLARDVANNAGLTPPSEIVIPFLLGNKNPLGKMSSSVRDSAIRVNDTPEAIKSLINKSYTGSLTTLAGHKKYGAIPEICPVFQILNYLHEDSVYVENVKEEYKRGTMSTSELKTIVTNFLIETLTCLQSKASKVTSEEVESYILQTRINSL
jgi:tryptophanyl-tRNA synthetase